MRNPLHNKRREQFKEEDLIKMRHDMMCVYGWISTEEFKKIKIHELWDLYEHVTKELKMKHKQYQVVLSQAGVKKNQMYD